jgi:CubicO group peptidase (beta-lactamase class C family)
MHFRMMAVSVALAGCLFMSSFSFPVSAAEPMGNLDTLLEPVREEFELPALVAAVAKDGKIVASGAVGLRAIGYDMIATPEDRIHIGSDGKALTSLVAAALVEKGALKWDSTIGEVLGERVPGMNPKLAAVQLKQLLTHTSGIPADTPEMMDIYFNDNAFDYNPPTLRLMALDSWKHNAPVIPEGSPFQYSNFGYMIAGAMMEEVTGKPWEILIRERIYEPLGLKSGGFGATATQGFVDAMAGHITNPDGTVEARLWGNGADMPQLLGPAGVAHMSILDFARWGSWVAGGGHRGPALVKPSTLDYLTAEQVRTPPRPNPPPGTPAEGGYAFGWGIQKFDWSDRELLTHSGSNGMNLAEILIDFENDLAVVVATNKGGSKAKLAAGKVMRELYARFRR